MTINKDLVCRRFAANFGRYNLVAHTQQAICGELAAMVAGAVGGSGVRRAMEIGAGTGFLTGRLTAAFPEAGWWINDLSRASWPYLEPMLGEVRHTLLWGDAERVAFPSGLDLIGSASTVQWFDNLPAFFAKCAEALRPGGVLALSSFGPDNFLEIKQLTGQGLTYPTLVEIEAMLAASGFELVESREYTKSVEFCSPLEVLHHIKATGVNSLGSGRWTRGRLAAFEKEYNGLFAVGQGVKLTYHPIIVTARLV